MKNSIIVLFILASLSGFSQDSEYNVSSYQTEGTKAPNTHYIGEAWLNAIIHDDTELGYNITKATFKANSTLDWHTHSTAQVLVIVDGEAYYQERGKEAVILKEGDVIKCEKDFCVVKANARKEGKAIQTFGSALKGAGFKDGNTNTWYTMEMAEKRAMSRLVLKVCGFYELGN